MWFFPTRKNIITDFIFFFLIENSFVNKYCHLHCSLQSELTQRIQLSDTTLRQRIQLSDPTYPDQGSKCHWLKSLPSQIQTHLCSPPSSLLRAGTGVQLKCPCCVLWWPLDVFLPCFVHQGMQAVEGKACLQTFLLHMGSCETRGIGDTQPAAPGLQMLWRGLKLIWKTYTHSFCCILSISSDKNKYMDSQKELKISQRDHLPITWILFWEKLQDYGFPRLDSNEILTTDREIL